MQKTLTVYFDFISPYVYFAWEPLLSLLQKHKVDLNLKPVLFAGLLNAHGSKGPAEIPAKRTYVLTETLRLGMIHGKKIKSPPTHPFNPLPLLRLCEAVENAQDKLKLAIALSTACWEEGLDLSCEETLVEVANRVGLDGKELMLKTQAPAIKEKIKKNTEEALSKGAFGVPSFIVDNQIFWGHDRIGHVDRYLQGKLNVENALLNDILARPRGADRK
ncbi:MAG TPA: 2-hydroxychromene-2-carboxylate isomerase [Deltaproteobacteria bacterium]|nr:MAG: hypothetical protein A2048_00295 [Deltaproteobacteria bacterium GWA2_45_12]HBF13467.1 2-hydroxychromene-2-carboxylate isomerase [Deltaproteobacteria bacterium]